MKLVNKLWTKFTEEGSVECFCNEYSRKCDVPLCKEYVVKFTEINRDDNLYKIEEAGKSMKTAVKDLKRIRDKMRKGIDKFKI